MPKENILIVDDEQEIGELIGLYLRKEGFDFCIALNGKEAITKIKRNNPDVILLDIQLPDVNGLDLCQQIRGLTQAPIIFVSCKDTDVDKVVGLSMGGDDYVSKPFSAIELVARVRAHIRRYRMAREPLMKSELTSLSSSSIDMDLDSYEVFANGKKVELSAKEFQILELMMRHPRKVLSTEQFIQKIWGYEYEDEIETKTVKVHVGNLRKKIERDPSNPNIITTIRGIGYKFNEHVKTI